MQTLLMVVLVAFFAGDCRAANMAFRRAKQAQGQPAPDTHSVDGAAAGNARRVYYFLVRIAARVAP